MQMFYLPRRSFVALSRLLLVASASLAPLSAQTIFQAARDGNLAAVELMATKNRSLVTQKDAGGLTPLHWAAAQGRTGVAAWLLDHGAKVDARDARSSDALREEADEQSTPPEMKNVSRGTGFGITDPVSPSDPPDAHTPLHWAAACGHLDMVRLLLDRGADVKATDRHRLAPLHYAAQYGHTDIVTLLAERGAPVNAEAIPGYTPLLYAAICDWPERGADVMRALLRAGADPRADRRRGARTLTMAANHGNVEALRVLLDAGADPNAPDERGYLPLHQAANILNPVEPMRVLLAHGALPDPVDSTNRCTPLLYLRAGGLQAVQLLVEAGARVNRRDVNGDTPLHVAAAFDSGAALTYLFGLGRGLDPNARGYAGETPLHRAAGAYHGNVGAVAALIQGGAEVDARDSSGRTPLHHATLRGNEEVVAFLLDHGATASVRDGSGNTPFMYAVRNGNTRMAELIRSRR